MRVELLKSSGNLMQERMLSRRHFPINDQNNLISDSNIFDDHVNFRKTSKIWMYLDRDYSINNRLIAEDYNNHGLPIKILGSFENNYEPAFLGFNIAGAIIKYSCS